MPGVSHVSDTYRREVDIPFRSNSNPDLRDNTGVGTDIGACRSSGGTARRGRAVTFRSCSEVAQGICAVAPARGAHEVQSALCEQKLATVSPDRGVGEGQPESGAPVDSSAPCRSGFVSECV